MIEIIERDDGFWIVQTEMTDLCDEPFASVAEAESALKEEVYFEVSYRPAPRLQKGTRLDVEVEYFSSLEAAREWIAKNRGSRFPAHSKNWIIDCHNFAGEYLRFEIVPEEDAA